MYELRDNAGEIITSGDTLEFGNNTVTLGGLTLKKSNGIFLFKDGVEVNLTNAQADQESDYDNWSLKEKSFIKLMVKQFNHLRGLHGESAFTKKQVISALKAER